MLDRDDDTASARLAELFLPLLINALSKRFASLPDPHEVESAAIDTLIGYMNRPEKFDPGRGSLMGYLYMDASANLSNSLKRQKKVVGFSGAVAEHELRSDLLDPEAELIEKSSPLLERAIAAITDPVDREVLLLMMEGARDCGDYVALLDIEYLPRSKQTEIVNRRKERLKKFLRRKLERHLNRK
jgi:RNA polymerase sigma-70 factor (ECF subfamily)